MPPLDFVVRELDVVIPEGIPLRIGGRPLPSGPVHIRLDDADRGSPSGGSLDYEAHLARASFHVRLDLPALRFVLEAAGLDEDIPPVRGEVRCVGTIHPDHSFSLGGTCRLAAPDLFRAGALEGEILTGT
jgi:hypothetical protein